MPTRRGPGRPLDPWRPRKLEQDYIDVSEGLHKPLTRKATLRAIRVWADFLRRRAVDSDAVTIHDLVAWELELVGQGFTQSLRLRLAYVRSFYLAKGSRNPDSKWSKLAAELKAHRMPKRIGKTNPHKPLLLQLLPKILEAARHVRQYSTRNFAPNEIYSEAYAVVATFLYTGGRAQWYGITDAQVRDALKNKYIELFVKEGEFVHVPIHDRLLAIWREHLEKRDFAGPFFFRHGRNPYTYQEGSKDWRADARSADTNSRAVERVFHPRGGEAKDLDCVERRLRELFGISETVTSHRFRKSVGTYMEQYGFPESERRLQLSHGARSITQDYSVPQVRDSQRKLSQLDLGSAEWVAAHDPPSNLFAGNGHDVDEDLVAGLRKQLAAADGRAQKAEERADRLEKKLDDVLARLESKVIA